MATLSVRGNVGQMVYQLTSANPGTAVTTSDIELNINLVTVLSSESVILMLDEMKKAFVQNGPTGLISIP